MYEQRLFRRVRIVTVQAKRRGRLACRLSDPYPFPKLPIAYMLFIMLIMIQSHYLRN